MTGHERQPASTRASTALAAALPLVVVLVLVGIPVCGVLWRLAGRVPIDSDGGRIGVGDVLMAMARTLAAVGAIAGIATLLGTPVGWGMRWIGGRAGEGGRRARGARALGALVLVPMLMPNYFAYAGWNMLRGPSTRLGTWLANSPAWVSDWSRPVFAVGGLALWSWPLVALMVSASARRVEQGVVEQLDLDGATGIARIRVITRLILPGIVGGFLLVLLVLSGSMVPLDVAQLKTYGVVLLRWVNEHPSDLPVWRACWPLILLAVVATCLILRPRAPESAAAPDDGASGRRMSSRAWVCLAFAWGMSVVVPAAIYLINLRDPPHPATGATIARWVGWFWREWGPAARESSLEAAGVAGIGTLVGVVMWWGASGERSSRRAATFGAGALLTLGLLPGILIGTALRRTTDMFVPAVGDTLWIVVWAHLSRFAFVPALAGVWLARQEERSLVDIRRLEGATTARGFVHACLRRSWTVLLGASLVTGILSFHEIEATVAVWPPGIRNLAQEMLDALHFDRDQHMAAAAVNLVGIGVVVSYAAAWLVLGVGRRFGRAP